MTQTVSTATDLPDYNGEPVRHCKVKFVGSGTGLSGLDVQPVVMDLHDQGYFVVRVQAEESASHIENKDGELVRVQRLHMRDMAPIDQATAQKTLETYRAEVERLQNEVKGQLMLEAEQAAEERERADLASTGSARDTQRKQPKP